MRALVLMAAVATASAQYIVDPAKLPEQWKSFTEASGDQRLRCRVSSITPTLNYGFRFHTGYVVEVPMQQFSGAGHRWSVVLRVTPKANEREPVWLLSQLKLPHVPQTNARAEVSGSYLVGEGEYKVDMLLIDDRNRICTDDWKIRARLKSTVRDVRPGLPPGVVDDISLRRWRRMMPEEDPEDRRYNVSILLHASAISPQRVRLRGYDRMLLMSALSSLVERLPVRNVRLTVFSMDKQQEIYHTPELSPRSFQQALGAMERVELGTIDYNTLKNRTGHIDLVADLLNRELTAADPPDAVLFLGPVSRYTERVKNESIVENLGSRPLYYVQLRPFRTAYGLMPDSITNTLRRLGGKTRHVYSPNDFAEAIQEVERLLAESNRGS